MVTPSQGVHLVVDREFLPGKYGLLVPKTRDGRVLFAVPWLGISGVHQGRSFPEGASPSFQELAAVGGAVISPLDRWSFTIQVRTPIAVSEGTAKQITGGVAARWVVGQGKSDH